MCGNLGALLNAICMLKYHLNNMISIHMVTHQLSISGNQHINNSIYGCLHVDIFNALAKGDIKLHMCRISKTMHLLYCAGENYI